MGNQNSTIGLYFIFLHFIKIFFTKAQFSEQKKINYQPNRTFSVFVLLSL